MQNRHNLHMLFGPLHLQVMTVSAFRRLGQHIAFKTQLVRWTLYCSVQDGPAHYLRASRNQSQLPLETPDAPLLSFRNSSCSLSNCFVTTPLWAITHFGEVARELTRHTAVERRSGLAKINRAPTSRLALFLQFSRHRPAPKLARKPRLQAENLICS